MNKLLVEFLGLLEALRISHHVCHLTVKGKTFWGDHQMFAKLYDGLVGEFDEIGEHAVRLGADPCPCTIAETAAEWLERWTQKDCIQRALAAERAVQTALAALVRKNADADIGLDDTLRAISASHSTAVYLLQQSVL
jgi:DNA-binding ferritin-like protein